MNLTEVYLSIGSNLNDPMQKVQTALQLISQLPDISHFNASKLYQTPPHEAEGPDFTNAACTFKTTLSLQKLWEHLEQIEVNLGKQPKNKKAARPIDIDIILFGNEIHGYNNEPMNPNQLIIPHPKWRQRLFVLIPLSDLTDYITIPVTNDNSFNLPLKLQRVNLNKCIDKLYSTAQHSAAKYVKTVKVDENCM